MLDGVGSHVNRQGLGFDKQLAKPKKTYAKKKDNFSILHFSQMISICMVITMMMCVLIIFTLNLYVVIAMSKGI